MKIYEKYYYIVLHHTQYNSSFSIHRAMIKNRDVDEILFFNQKVENTK